MIGLSQRGRAALAATITLAAGACAAAPPPMPSEGEIKKTVIDTVSAWTSADAARIKAVYAPDVIGYDFGAPDLTTDRATWDKAQDAFAAAKFDGSQTVSQKTQVLDTDTFVLSGTYALTSRTTPANNTTVRCTDVFHKEAADKWLVVNEHCSAVPKAA